MSFFELDASLEVVQLCFGGFYPGEWQFLYMDILAPVLLHFLIDKLQSCCEH